jgi:hypothetical protein
VKVSFFYYACLTTSLQIFLVGLALQLASFTVFTYIYLVFLYRVYKRRPEVWEEDHPKRAWYSDWRSLAAVLLISCIGILVCLTTLKIPTSGSLLIQIRSCYRVAELSKGFDGALTTSEPFFYGLDTLPLFIATAVYIPFWPGRFIQEESNTVIEMSGA